MTVEDLLRKYTAGVYDFSGIDLSEANLSRVKLVGVNLTQANMSVINLSGANLSKANLTNAILNVARLSGANLAQAILNQASLNVANLIRADLNQAQLREASLIRAEMIRANLSGADLSAANLTSADLREATLRQANFRKANLSGAILRGSSLIAANLEMANLHSADLVHTDLSGANLRDAELRKANLSRANLSGADLSGANLRWADLSGANLRWADLSGAKLSGAKLISTDLSNANLTNASLVHADLTQAKLIKAEWNGADLTSAILTGAKLYATSRYGLKTEGITCEWIDLSPTGDRSIIQKFNAEDARDFFNETSPTIRIIVDAPLEHEANFTLAGAYYQISRQYRRLKQPPTMEIGRRRTVFTFRVERDEDLFPLAYIAILPFMDAASTQQSIEDVIDIIKGEDISYMGVKIPHRVRQLRAAIDEARNKAQSLKEVQKTLALAAKLKFFKTPTQTILTNSSAQTLIIYDNPYFGKRFISQSDNNASFFDTISSESSQYLLPTIKMIKDFVKSFHYIEE
ncbi:MULTISPECIES: pentapeptide repeat-containing protein [Calothrix]|uniref:Pentapeptide repeat-containing protein n=2 Tax=Calothrix TaxID=1186 RepID=A0ABR8ACJ6_9CYAN|nr:MULTISPECIES: pentapeptide repeat-containing protein [Calothrix]MBD2197484.1 pentapeptide repeat-containing protein [Calothrix parietina FACHB-288]MBD2226051.1 pentapeptide repeat-containing protein [Calothrix anomala FACHB-343]